MARPDEVKVTDKSHQQTDSTQSKGTHAHTEAQEGLRNGKVETVPAASADTLHKYGVLPIEIHDPRVVTGQNESQRYMDTATRIKIDSAKENETLQTKSQEHILLAQAKPEHTERQLHQTTVQDLKDEGVMLRRYQQEDRMYGTHKYADEMKYLNERLHGGHEGPLTPEAYNAIMYWKDHNYGKDEIGNWANRYAQSNLTDQQVQADLRQKMNDPKFPMTEADAIAVLNAYRAEKNRH